MAALDHFRCSVCHKAGGNHCMSCRVEASRPSLEAPAELPGTWEMFTDEALIVLLADASSELGKRNVPVVVSVKSTTRSRVMVA